MSIYPLKLEPVFKDYLWGNGLLKKLYNKKNNIENVTAITAVELSDELKAKLISKLEKESGKKIQLETKVDKEILGGIILRTENSQTDASVRARLDAIKAQLSSEQID